MTLREAFLKNPDFRFANNIFYQQNFPTQQKQERHYLAIRKLEGRIYDDAIVQHLPKIPESHPLASEWLIRERSASRLMAFLSKRPELKILEVGCGNGWLSNKLSELKSADVVGLDVNEEELVQGSRVFAKNNLTFTYSNIFTCRVGVKFDAIILASSLQYFSSVPRLIDRLFELMDSNGEIHILDTPLYHSTEIDEARRRTDAYYQKLNQEPKPDYHHHTWDSLTGFNFQVMYNPRSLASKFMRMFVKNESPFPWVIIKK